MNQAKIGKFITICRKKKGWTQGYLAEQLDITDKAVSKWETGKSMPDVSLFRPLCDLLGITLNELFLGEFIPEEALKEKSEEILMEVISSWLGQDNWTSNESNYNTKVVLEVNEIQKTYESDNTKTTAIQNISFQVQQGSFVSIMGASGSGKSTLLNLIASIDKPTSGTILINGKNTAEISEHELAKYRRENLGFIFQEYNLLDSLTIYENIALALTIKEVPKKKINQKIYETAKKLDIVSILNKFPYEVSGGQRQRCACARAIVVEPTLILADEPTGALDSFSAKQLLDILVLLCQEYNATILMVTHDVLSASYCDKVFFMQDGKIQKTLARENKTKKEFFTGILDSMAQITGG